MSTADSAAPRSDRRHRGGGGGGGRGRGWNRGGGGRGGGEGRSRGPSSGGGNNPSASQQAWVPRGGPISSAAAPDHNPPQQMNQTPVDRGILGLPPPRDRTRSRRPSRPNPTSLPHRNHQVVPSAPVRPQPASEDDGSVPQLVQEIQDKLSKGAVECMICYDMVRRSAPIWSCSSCYSIFHLPCIKKWARSPTSTDTPSITAASSGADGRTANWRCPGCQSVQQTAAKDIQYTCFCGARRDPPNDLYLTPHSCGEPCGKRLDRISRLLGEDDDDRCPHQCVLQCHPGPCPPCKAFAEERRCPCGKNSIMRRCSDRKSPLSCGERCDLLLSCGRHRCERVCHTGPCGDCMVLISASCFCKKKTEMVLCGEMEVKGKYDELDGIFSCGSVCDKSLSCTNHTCEEVCHPGPCGQCILSPSSVKTCHCGKTPLKNERISCLDPVPTCSAVCDKLLPCRIHHCKGNCHDGSCPPCLVSVNQKCRCGFTSRQIECFKTLEEHGKFLCEKPCGRKKNCGRHRCSEKCCPLSSNNIEQFSGDWDPHLCQMPCGKKLRCGQHSCQNLCHSGHCPPCLETVFTDLTCSCGKTSIPPPIPCGTPYPSCPHPCIVPQPCGHSATHTCHFGDCPPCSVPVAKECIGGHVVLRNIPCGSRDIRCNQLCGKTRQCGMHACARTCHPAPCDAGQNAGPSGVKASCGQTCGAPRRDCRHTCTSVCHPSSTCPDLRCEFHVTITCSCGRITANVPCSAGGNASDPLQEALITQKLPVPLLPLETNGRRVPLGQRKLTCDEECEKWERKKALADAFDVTPPSLDALHFGENSALSDMLTDIFRRDPKWVLAVEERFKFMVLGKTRGASTSSPRVHVFSAMTKDKRDVVRQMAERWKLTVHAAGWEPRRFLVVHTTPKSKAPSRILGSKPGAPIIAAPPPFDGLVDIDPRLVISLLDLPSESDVSALVLRFGGECELVWLNDKNALAIFSDPARAATALRRLDRGSLYQGASALVQSSAASGSSGSNVWGMGSREAGSGVAKFNNPWKKAVVSKETTASWGELDAAVPMWKVDEAPIPASMNRWTVLERDVLSSSSSLPEIAGAHSGPQAAGASSSQQAGIVVDSQRGEELDDWEEAYE